MYECHVTLLPQYEKDVEGVARQHKFHMSVLMGDPELGEHKYLYCTSHDSTFDGMKGRMEALVAALHVPHIRRKIEHIVLDEREGR